MDTAPPIGALPRPVVSPLHRRGGEATRFPSPSSHVPITPPRPTVVRLNRSASPPTCEIAAQLPPSQWLPPPRSPGDDRRSEWAASRRSSLATEAAAAATKAASAVDASPAAAYVSSYVGVVSPSPLRSATATPSAIHPQSTPLAALASSDYAPVPVMSPRAVEAALPANRDWPATSPRRVPRPVLGAAPTTATAATADSTPLRLPPRSPGRPTAVEPTSTPSRIQHVAADPAATTAASAAPLAALPTTTPTRRRFDALAGTPEVSPAREHPAAARRGSMVEVAAELRRNLDRVKELEYAAGLVPGRSVLTHVSSGKDVTVSPVGKGRAGHTVVSASPSAGAPAPLKSPSRLAASPDPERLAHAQARSALVRAAEQQQRAAPPSAASAAANPEVAALRAQLDKAEHLCANLLDDKRSLQRELDAARGTIADLRRQVRRRDEAEAGADAHDDVASYSSLMEVRQRLSSATEPAKTASSSTLTRSPERRHSYY